MIFIPSVKLASLVYPLACALVPNLTSPISSQQAQNRTTASSIFEDLQLGEKVGGLTFDESCNGAASGVGLTEENCYDAVSQGIPDVTGKDLISYGDRSVGNFDVNLPQRYISGDGCCIIDLTIEDVNKKTPYFPFGIALAATFLTQKCVAGQSPAQGGTLEGFGLEGSDGSQNLKVVLKTYQPNVGCVGQTMSPDIRKSCQSLLDTMAVDEVPIAFGVTRDSAVRTPYSRVSADRLCAMEIDTSGVRSDAASWRDFWEVGVALNGMCIRKGREGFQINIGAVGGLHMELKDNRNLGRTISST